MRVAIVLGLCRVVRVVVRVVVRGVVRVVPLVLWHVRRLRLVRVLRDPLRVRRNRAAPRARKGQRGDGAAPGARERQRGDGAAPGAREWVRGDGAAPGAREWVRGAWAALVGIMAVHGHVHGGVGGAGPALVVGLPHHSAAAVVPQAAEKAADGIGRLGAPRAFGGARLIQLGVTWGRRGRLLRSRAGGGAQGLA